MQLEVGAILEGKVTGITNFWRFCRIRRRQNRYGTYFGSGSNLCERDSEYVTEIQTVKVKVLSVGRGW